MNTQRHWVSTRPRFLESICNMLIEAVYTNDKATIKACDRIANKYFTEDESLEYFNVNWALR